MVKRYLLGLDVGSSSVKASVVDSIDGKCCGTSFFPKQEAPIKALRTGWAEQAPSDWWQYAKDAIAECLGKASLSGRDIAAIGISYQMHGLVCVDRNLNELRDSIIWCDSRARVRARRRMDVRSLGGREARRADGRRLRGNGKAHGDAGARGVLGLAACAASADALGRVAFLTCAHRRLVTPLGLLCSTGGTHLALRFAPRLSSL